MMASTKVVSAVIFLFLGWVSLSSGCFTHTFPLPTDRFSPTIASVDNFVIFIGGRMTTAREIILDTIDVMDTTVFGPNRWISSHVMNSRRVRTLTATIGNKLLILGGVTGANEAVRDVELLNFESSPILSLIGTIDYSNTLTSDNNFLTQVNNELVISIEEGLLFYDYTTGVTKTVNFTSSQYSSFTAGALFSLDNQAFLVFNDGVMIYRSGNYTLEFHKFENGPITGRIIGAYRLENLGYIVSEGGLITFNTQSLDIVLGQQISNLVHSAVVHDNNLFMFTGPSRGVVNTVTTFQGHTRVKFSLPYTRYNFASDDFAVVGSGNNLYVVGWTFNSPVPSTQVLVYDIANSRHQFTAFDFTEDFDLEALHEQNDRIYTIVRSPSDGQRELIIYNLLLRTGTAYPLTSPYEFKSAHAINGSDLIYFHGSDSNQLVTDILLVYNPNPVGIRVIVIPNGYEIANLYPVGTKIFVDRRSLSLPISVIDIYDSTIEQWTTHNVSSPQLAFFVLNKGNKLVILADHFAMLYQFDVYDYNRDRWSVIQVETPRRFATSEIVDDILYIAGGVSEQGVYLDTIEVYDLVTLQKINSLTLQEPRRLIVIESLQPYLVFAGGELADGSLSAHIEIFNTQNQSWHGNALFPLPELIGLNFGISSVGTRLFFRYNNYVYILDLTNMRIDPLMIPFLSGYGSHVIGTNIIFYGQYGRLSVYFFYEVTTGSVFQINTPHVYERKHTLLWRNQFVFFMRGVAVVPVPLMLNSLTNKHVFMDQSVEFYVNATGNSLRYSWRFNDRPLNASSSTLTVPISRLQNGAYTVHITDHCQATTSQSASLIVEPPPTFVRPFSQVVALCNTMARLEVETTGEQVDVHWTLNDGWLSVSGWSIEINLSDLDCDSTHRLCAIAANPSGSVPNCGSLQLLDITRVFNGPRPTSNNPFLTEGSHITLQMDVLYEGCTNHTWYKNNEVISSSDDFSSTFEFEIGSTAQPGSKFYVVAVCGGSRLTSDPYIVPSTTIPVWAFIIIMIGGIAIVGAVVFFTLRNYKKLQRSREQETELKSMLNKAHEETLAQRNNKGAQLISCVTWEWEPDNTFSFTPIDHFPVRIDTAHLSLGKKSDLLEVDVWTQGTIEISSKTIKKKARISSFLNQRLIEDAPRITIYAPQSPKFEVKVSPETFSLEDGTDVTVTVSVRLRITTKVKIKLLIVLDDQRVYSSIDFTLASLPSPWIDLEDVKMSGDFLGRGGFGSVVRGTYKGQDVAVKTLKEDIMQEQEKKEFDREVMIMRSLRHPNIVQFIGASNIMNRVAIVTELAPLGSLASLLAKDILISYPLKLEILLEIAKAIQFLHANDVIHRDIKPGNVLVFSLELKATTHVKVSDFGTSKFVAEQASPMTKNTGTVNYNAPETVGKNPLYTFSADIFSFAIMMWEVITSEPAFSVAIHPDFAFDYKIEEHIVEGRRLEIPRDVDPRLAALITDCWAHDPKDRPTSDNLVQRLSALAQETRH